MKDTQSRYSWFSLVILLIPLVWLIWACLSQVGILSEIFQAQRRDLCEAIGISLCTQMYVSIFEMLGQPENWWLQEFFQEITNELSNLLSIFSPLDDETLRNVISNFFDKVYFALLILSGHFVQIIFCAFLALPIFCTTFVKGVTKIKIKRLNFQGEIPSLMKKKWLVLKCLLVATLCVSCSLIHVSMETLMFAIGIAAFFAGKFQGIVHETNQS